METVVPNKNSRKRSLSELVLLLYFAYTCEIIKLCTFKSKIRQNTTCYGKKRQACHVRPSPLTRPLSSWWSSILFRGQGDHTRLTPLWSGREGHDFSSLPGHDGNRPPVLAVSVTGGRHAVPRNLTSRHGASGNRHGVSSRLLEVSAGPAITVGGYY